MEQKFDILEFYKLRGGLSWSSISSFEWDPEQWYQSYIKGIRQESKELFFGSFVDKKIQDDPNYLPAVERYPIMQHEMRIMFDGIPLVGFADGYDPGKTLADYKTGKKAWTQKRADETGQLTMYAFMLYLIDKVRPADMTFRIVWLPTVESGDFSIQFKDDPVKPKVFNTTRSMLDILQFGQRIKATLDAMQSYAQARLDEENMKV